MRRFVAIILLALALVAATAPGHAFDRREVLRLHIDVKLAKNPPWILGKSDCSTTTWDLVSEILVELRASKWFRKAPAAAQALWPFPKVETRPEIRFGDLLFYVKRPGRPGPISHEAIADDPVNGEVVINHASSSRGYIRQPEGPYWRPKLVLAIRPPY